MTSLTWRPSLLGVWGALLCAGCPGEKGDTDGSSTADTMGSSPTDATASSTSPTGSTGPATTEPGTSTGPATTESATTDDSTTADSTTADSTTVASTTTTSGGQVDCAVVEFPDAGLEFRIRELLQQPEGPLLGADVAAIEELFPTLSTIADLTGLECAAGLRIVNLVGQDVTDLGPLAGLQKLESINVGVTQVVDLGPLAGLPALQFLDVSSTAVADLGPLAGLGALEFLDISSTEVDSLGPLAGLSGLRQLVAQGTDILDVEALAGLTGLVQLNIAETAVTDLGPLAGLTALEVLMVHHTDIADLAPLTGLPIRFFFAENAMISDLTPVASFPTPTTMILSDNQIVDTDPLVASGWDVSDNPDQCLEVILTGNPLSADALAVALPAFCAATGAWVWADGLMDCPGGSPCVIPP
ncbi:hypothetical protein [Nannocystis pusilla]|uniref:hypothetical protein n=1 Tax=Nannocystis pusilla TaxID=889268 RepID=UPI003BF32637